MNYKKLAIAHKTLYLKYLYEKRKVLEILVSPAIRDSYAFADDLVKLNKHIFDKEIELGKLIRKEHRRNV